jgi:STE24 endopeptidase
VIVALLLAATLGILIAGLTPWEPLPGAPTAHVSLGQYFTSAQIARSQAFHNDISWPAWLSLLASLAVPLLLGCTPLGRPLIEVVRARTRRWSAQVIGLTTGVILLQQLAILPFDGWAHIVATRYGLATSSWAVWTSDELKSIAISVVLSVVVVLGIVAFARRFPSHWYLPSAAAAATVVVIVSFAYPVVVEPLFNSFSPLPDGPLRTRLLDLASKEGVDVHSVLVANASARTTALNAYVSGFGDTRRIVIYDTLLHTESPNEIAVVVAHELGHAANNDVLVGTLEGGVGAALAVTLLYLLLGHAPLLRPGAAKSPGDPAVVPMILALVALGTFLALPIQNTVSRRIEARADATALNLTRDPGIFIAVQKQLALSNLSHLQPNPVLAFWFDDHPDALTRIEMAVAWERMQDRSHAAQVPRP